MIKVNRFEDLTCWKQARELRKLLYERMLVGYSKTALVFGRDKTLNQLLEILEPIFLSENLRKLLVERRFISADEKEKLHLACNRNRELVYSVAG